MWPDRVSNPGPPTYESGALPIAPRGPASIKTIHDILDIILYIRYLIYKISIIIDIYLKLDIFYIIEYNILILHIRYLIQQTGHLLL